MYKPINRRSFLATSTALGAGLSITKNGKAAAPAKQDPTTTQTLPTRTLGKTGIQIPILGFGSSIANLSGGLLNMAHDKGIRYIDTSQRYLRTQVESTIGETLERSGTRNDWFITTKSRERTVKAFAQNVTGCLQRLRTDYLDAYFWHGLEEPDDLSPELKQEVEALKKAGKIKFFGFSCHADRLIEIMHRAAEVGFVDLFMFRYNFRDYGNDALNRAIDKCTQANIGLAAMKTQGGAVASHPDMIQEFKEKGFNKHQAALKAVWEDERIHVAVTEMETYPKIEENTHAAKNKTMTSSEKTNLRRYAQATDHLYCRGCSRYCESRLNQPFPIADMLRCLMYHDNYEKKAEAQSLFHELGVDRGKVATADFPAAEAACPHGIPLETMVKRAYDLLT
ncbi:aldo/keto reductase [bacterium]|nr:aldo/keto reductase [bacterium]